MNLILIELGKAIGNVFLNPLIYWIIFISFIISRRRIKDELSQFKQQLFPMGAEYKNTKLISFIGFINLSSIALFFNITFINEIILFLSVIIFIVSFAFGFKLLSAAYTLSFTFILLKLLELSGNRLFELGYITNHTFSGIALLIGFLLFFEAKMYQTISNENSFPEIVKSKRGSWFGLYHIQRASIIPFFVLIPGKITINQLPILPFFTIGNEQVSFALIPFIIGFHYMVKGQYPEIIADNLRKYNTYLSYLVLITALVSFYLPGIAILSIGIALLGKIYINYMLAKEEREKDILFIDLNDELKIFAVLPHSPADMLGLKIGDTIIKINDQKVTSLSQVHKKLEHPLRFPDFEVITSDHEVRTIKNTKYKGSMKEFGIIFASKN